MRGGPRGFGGPLGNLGLRGIDLTDAQGDDRIAVGSAWSAPWLSATGLVESSAMREARWASRSATASIAVAAWPCSTSAGSSGAS